MVDSQHADNPRTLRRGVGQRLHDFHNHHPLVGAFVYVSSILYFFAQVFVGWIWTSPQYSLWTNTISDLGNTHCGAYRGSQVCSHRHGWMNLAFVFVGLVMVVGSSLLYHEFERRSWDTWRFVGFAVMAIGGVGAILVGAFPENENGTGHVIGASLAIGGGNIALLILAIALRGDIPERLRRFMLWWAPISLVASFMFVFKRHFGLGSGGLERIAAYPETIWLISLGAWLAHDSITGRRPGAPAAA